MPTQLEPALATTAPTKNTQGHDTTQEAIAQRARLFADFIDTSQTLIDIANQHNIPLTEVVAWAERPEVIAFLERLTIVSERRARLFASMAAPDAVNAINHAMHAQNPETSRRAAGTILRHTKPLKNQPKPTDTDKRQPVQAPSIRTPSIRTPSASSGTPSKAPPTQDPPQPSEHTPSPRATDSPPSVRRCSVSTNSPPTPTPSQAAPCNDIPCHDAASEQRRVPVPVSVPVPAHVPISVPVETPAQPARLATADTKAKPPRRSNELAAAA